MLKFQYFTAASLLVNYTMILFDFVFVTNLSLQQGNSFIFLPDHRRGSVSTNADEFSHGSLSFSITADLVAHFHSCGSSMH
jgi:hypothetical protein